MPGFASGFFQEMDVTNSHPPVNRFAHVIDREECNLYGGECFHFYAGLIAGFGGGQAINDVFAFSGFEFDINMGDGNRMAERDEFRGFLGRHYAGNTRNTEYIAFFVFALKNKLEGLRLHVDHACGDGTAVRDGFIAHIDHVGFTFPVKVCQFSHGIVIPVISITGRNLVTI